MALCLDAEQRFAVSVVVLVGASHSPIIIEKVVITVLVLCDSFYIRTKRVTQLVGSVVHCYC
jgi:hypothetical protein